MLRRSFLSYSERPFIGEETLQGNKQFEWITYGETYSAAAKVVRALLSLGVPRGSFVGMCAHNSAAHVQTMLALMMGGFVAVPLSLHLSEGHARHIVEEARLRAVFVSPATAERYAGFAAALPADNTFHVLQCLNGPAHVLAAWADCHTNPILDQVTALPATVSDTAPGRATTLPPAAAAAHDDGDNNADTAMALFYHGESSEVPSFFHAFEGLIDCPSLFDGSAWLQVQITTEPKSISKVKHMIQQIRGRGGSANTEHASGRPLWEAHGRWQLNGTIEEVRVTWFKEHVALTNKVSNKTTAPQYISVVLPLNDFEAGNSCHGQVWPAAGASQAIDPIGTCEFSPISLAGAGSGGPSSSSSDVSDDGGSGGGGGDSGESFIGWKCPVGHQLRQSTTIKKDPRVCDVCNTLLPDNATIHACKAGEQCPAGYDVCDGCHKSTKLCPQGHATARFLVGKHVSVVCDLCSADLLKGAVAYGCIACDFDVCSDCVVAHPEGPQPERPHSFDATASAGTAGKSESGAGEPGAVPENKRAGSEPVMILYTSGSTGAPKGAVVSAAAFYAEVHPFISINDDYDESSVGLVDSPLSVSATPYNLCYPMLNGGRVAVYSTLTRVFEVARIISPDSIGLVPQLWAALYKQYQEQIAAEVAVVMEQNENSASKGDVEAAVTAAVNQEFRMSLGFRCRALNCGGATPMPHVQAWLKRVFTQCFVTENYASTEAGPITNTMDGDTVDGAGRIQEGITVKLEDYGEYKTTDKPNPRGEILVKTAAGAVGYLNRPDLTAAAWDKDGFYHTGDIGEMPTATHIKIIDRKKNIFKLVNGEWVSPENVEAAYTGLCPSIAQVFVHGSSRHSHVVAIIVTTAGAAAAKRKVDEAAVLTEMKAAAAESGLRHFEVPLAVKVLVPGRSTDEDGFTVENGGLTQTCKLCRPKLRTRFETELQALFLETADIDARADDGRGETLVALLRKALAAQQGQQGGGSGLSFIDSKDDEAWAELEWDSIRTLLAVNLIKLHFHVDVSVDELLSITANGGGNLRDVAALVMRAKLGGVQGALSKEVTAAVLFQECKLPEELLLGARGATTAATLPTAASNASPSSASPSLPPSTTTSSPMPTTPMPTTTAAATPSGKSTSSYFLTGATGFLGAAILRYLAESHAGKDWSCCCLVRPGGNDADGGCDDADRRAFERLEKSLRRRKQLSPALASQMASDAGDSPIKIVGGTLGAPMFGLEKSRFMQLGAELGGGTILHCASHVSHIASYWSLKAANVDATTDLIKLSLAGSAAAAAATAAAAAATTFDAPVGGGGSGGGDGSMQSKAGLIHYVSTISVVDDGDDADESYVGTPEFMLRVGGYAQSKWVGEMRLREAAAASFIRLGIVRPGLLTPDTRSGSANLTDWLTRFIGGTLLIGGYRTTDDSSTSTSSLPIPAGADASRVHVTPVDHAAEYVCRLLHVADMQTEVGSSNSGGSTVVSSSDAAKAAAVFHLPLSVVMPASALMASVATASECTLNRKIRVLSEEQWAAALEQLPANNPLLPFKDMFAACGLGGISKHSHAATDKALGLMDRPRPYTDDEVALLVDYIAADSVVSEPSIVARTASGSAEHFDGDGLVVEGDAATAAGNGGKALYRWRGAGVKVKAAVKFVTAAAASTANTSGGNANRDLFNDLLQVCLD